MMHLYHSLKIALGMMGQRKAFAGPLWVQIGISDVCNHRCIMCWDHPSVPRQNIPVEADLGKTILDEPLEAAKTGIQFMHMNVLEDLVEDLRRLGTQRIELAGRGEPTLHPEFNRVVQMLKKHSFNVGIVTNASLLNPEQYDHLLKNDVDRVIISLNAADSGTYPLIHTTARPETFDQIIYSLQQLHKMKRLHGKKKPTVMLSYVISRANFGQGLEMIQRAKEVGAEQIVLKYAVPHPKVSFIELTEGEKREFSTQVPTFVKHAKSCGIDLKIEPPIGDMTGDRDIYHGKTKVVYSRIPCYIGWIFALVTAEGLVFPCCQCGESIGDLRKQRFREIWHSREYGGFRKRMKSLRKLKREPLNCQCDECSFEKINTTVYNKLHFYNPITLHHAQRDFSLMQLLPAILRGETTQGAKAHSK
jgi:wyosine [tRNA(Phe)-imidazoG37] synthetase (radical SAM superfamily)